MPAPNRNITSSKTSSYTWQQLSGAGAGSTGGALLGAQQTFRDYYSVSSVQTPGFRSLKKSQLPWHAYAKETILYNGLLGSYEQRHVMRSSSPAKVYRELYIATPILLGLNVDRVSFPTTEADDPSQKAISNLIEQISQNRAATAVSMAEAQKTFAHLAHTVSRLNNALRALRRARFGDFLGALDVTVTKQKEKRYYSNLRTYHGRRNEGFRFDRKFSFTREQQKQRFTTYASETWLEYSYGWRPLLQDVYDHAKAFAEVMTEHQAWRVGRGRSKTTKKTEWYDPLTGGQVAAQRSVTSRKWVEYVVEFRIPDGVLDYSAVFGLNNPAVVAWEVIPFSFIVDWFIPIGRALEALTAYQGLVFHRGSKSVRHVFTHHADLVAGNEPYTVGSDDYYFVSSDVQADFTNVGIARSLLGDFPAFGFPKWKDPRSFAHAASAIALLQSNFLGHGSQRRLRV